MSAIDTARLGSELDAAGWNDKDGTASKYKNGDSEYRTYKPWATATPEGGVAVSTKIDHIRGGAQDDHCLLTVTFDASKDIISASSIMQFAGIPQFDPVLIEKAVVAAGQEKYAAAAKVAAEVLNSLARFITDLTDHGGRANFPAVVMHNINIISKCVFEDPTTQTSYKITVVTGNLDNAGTGAEVRIILFGEYGHSGHFELDNRANNFEKGKTDTFDSPPLPRPDWNDLGELHKISIWHDDAGDKAGWYLDSVRVLNQANGRSWNFPCRSWLDRVQGTRRELLPEKDLVTYKIRVQTGDRPDAGTSARVTMRLIGSKGDIQDGLDNSRNNFEQGMPDDFEWQIRDLGELRELQISHDNTGDKPGWFLDSVIVVNKDTGRTWVFPCEQWLSVDAPDGLTSRRLVPDMSRTRQREPV